SAPEVGYARVFFRSGTGISAAEPLLSRRVFGLDIPADRTKHNTGKTMQERRDELYRVEGNWKEFKGKVQQKWGKLTNDDLDVIEGKRMQLSGRLQQRYGVAKDEAERQIDTWLKSVN